MVDVNNDGMSVEAKPLTDGTQVEETKEAKTISLTQAELDSQIAKALATREKNLKQQWETERVKSEEEKKKQLEIEKAKAKGELEPVLKSYEEKIAQFEAREKDREYREQITNLLDVYGISKPSIKKMVLATKFEDLGEAEEAIKGFAEEIRSEVSTVVNDKLKIQPSIQSNKTSTQPILPDLVNTGIGSMNFSGASKEQLIEKLRSLGIPDNQIKK